MRTLFRVCDALHIQRVKSKDLIVYITGGVIAAALIIFSFLRMTAKPAEPTVAPQPSAAQQPQTTSDVPRITLAEFQQHYDKGDVLVIDVRDADSYLASHIAGAIHIPVSYLEGEIPYLPPDQAIVTYCTCPAEESSGAAAQILRSKGFTASALLGGFKPWLTAGLPVREGKEP
jgi:rhodanese-related sulfurtransferase